MRLSIQMRSLLIEDLANRFEHVRGEITRTQTTYLDIRGTGPLADGKFRINYVIKREFSLQPEKFEQFRYLEEHPLLINYVDPIVSVHLASHVPDSEKFKKDLIRAATDFFEGWRSFESYMSMPLDKFLEKDFGILMTGPRSFAEAVVGVGQRNEVELVIRDGSGQDAKSKVILFDNMYVIADDFQVENLST